MEAQNKRKVVLLEHPYTSSTKDNTMLSKEYCKTDSDEVTKTAEGEHLTPLFTVKDARGEVQGINNLMKNGIKMQLMTKHVL